MGILDAYSFAFSNQSGWPNGNNGPWTHQHGSQTNAIASNEGTLVGNTNSFNVWTYGGSSRDVVLQIRYIPGSTSDLWGLVARYQGGNYYYCDVGNGGNLLEIGVFNGSFNALVNIAFSFSAGVAYQIKFRLEMAQLRAKVWLDGQAEPDWMLTISDDTYVVSGLYGVGAAAGSATPIQLDHFTVNTADFNYGPLISRNTRAFTNDNNSNANPAYFGNDAIYGTNSFWKSAATPTSGSPIYLAYDLSIISSQHRGNCILVWYNDPVTDTYNPNQIGTNYFNTPKSYTIDANTAAGGGALPGSGWTTLITVTGNNFHSRQHAINLTGYNWVRINVTDINGSTLNMAVAINMDVHDLSVGLDDWVFFGDSITQRGVDHSDTTLSAMINASIPNRYPIYENGGIGGTTSGDGATNIASWLSITSAKYITLNFGTNDALQTIPTSTFQTNMQTMITAVLNASKIPVIPHIPWGSASGLSTVPNYNAKIDLLVGSNPGVLKGPDFYAYYFNNQSLINSSDGIHPTDPAGYAAYRTLWANWLLTFIYGTTIPIVARGHKGIKSTGHAGSIMREQVGM